MFHCCLLYTDSVTQVWIYRKEVCSIPNTQINYVVSPKEVCKKPVSRTTNSEQIISLLFFCIKVYTFIEIRKTKVELKVEACWF